MSAMSDASKVHTVCALPLLRVLTEIRDLGRSLKESEHSAEWEQVMEVAKRAHIALRWFDIDQQGNFDEAQLLLDVIFKKGESNDE